MPVEKRGGSDGNIVRADPYSPKARRREDRWGVEGAKVVPAWNRAGRANGKTCSWHDKKPLAEVTHGSCRIRIVSRKCRYKQSCFFVFHKARTIFSSKFDREDFIVEVRC